MTQRAQDALLSFSQRYVDALAATTPSLPRNEELVDIVSPCVEEKERRCGVMEKLST